MSLNVTREMQWFSNDRETQEKMLNSGTSGCRWILDLLKKLILILAPVPVWIQPSFKYSGDKKLC